MKKAFLAILTTMYMTVTSGIALEIHYCMGKRAGIGLYGLADDKCGNCGMKEKKNSCCFDEHKFYKLSDSHKNVTNDISFSANEISVLNEYPLFVWQLPSLNTVVALNDHSPPDPSGHAACILNCVFRL